MNEDIKALKSELALLKLQFSERVGAVESRLNSLLAKDKIQAEYQPQNVTQDEENNPSIQQEKVSDVVLPETSTITTDEYLASRDEWSLSASSEPSFIAVFFQAIISSFFDWLSPVTKIYQSYKERGMLGIFILTIVGIGLTLAGFGYLMQLLIDQLGAGSKSLLMGTAAISVMGLGIGLKIKTRFGEFATAIVTLGILLSYSTVYFSGSVYGLLPNILVLILYLAIALVCHVLALWLDTKIVAALGIIGIATMPIFSNTISIEPLYYLLSLAFVVCSSLILAYRYVGQWLANLSLAFTIVALEWIIGVEGVHVSPWTVNLFYLLFFAYIVISLLKDKAPTNKTLTFLAALVGATVLVFFQATDIFISQISVSFAFNTLIAITVSVFFYRVKRELTHFFILLSAMWAILTIISAISDAYWGIAWAIEGILLLAIGRRYIISPVINQGQALTAIALLYSWSALAMYFPLPALKSVDGWLLSLVIVAIIATWQRLINNTELFDDATQNKIKPFLQLLEVIWLSIIVIASATIWLGNWTGAILILLQLALLFRAKSCKQVSIELLAAILIVVPLFYAYQGALMVDSYRFTHLPLFAKVAVVSAFTQLWLWSEFYRKYQPDSSIKYFAESARILFYMLLPVCWVGSTIRRLDENALMILWLSPLLALFLTNKIKHQLLVKETKLLTVLASLAFIVLVGQLKLPYSLIALTGFMVFYGAAFYFDKKIYRSELCQFICSWGVISVGFSIPSIIGFQSDSLLIGLIATSLFWVTYLAMLNLSEYLKRNAFFIVLINGILVISAWWLTSSNTIYISMPVMFLIAAIYQKNALFSNTRLGTSLGINGDILLHSIGAITYVTLFTTLVEYRLDLLVAPALAVHGALILFLKDRRLTTVKYSFGLILLGIIKLAMIDASSALLWQKVILFMGIGVFILAASFWYQKLVSAAEVQND